MSTLLKRRHYLGIHLQRLAHRINRHRHPTGFKRIQDSPHPDTGAILVITLRVERPLAGSPWSIALFPEEGLRGVVAVQDGAFGALERRLVVGRVVDWGEEGGYFFVVYHE